MNEYLDKIENFWNKGVRKAVEMQLKRDGETIIDFYPCVEAEHSWYGGTPEGLSALAERQKLGYILVLRNEKGETRSITFGSYIYDLMRKWRKYLKNCKKSRIEKMVE